MAYEKQTWVTGDVITAEKLNHIEDGIASGGGNFLVTLTPTGETTATSDKSSSEIIAAIKQGMIPFAVMSVNNEIVAAFQYICIIDTNGTPTVRFGYSYVNQAGEYIGVHTIVAGTTATMAHIELHIQVQ